MNNHISLRNSELTVLKYVLEHGPVHGYLIQKDTDLSDKTTYVASKELVKKGLLYRVAAEEQKRPGQPMQLNYLTLKGLCVGLGLSDSVWKKVDQIVKNWKHLLPFVFERWEVFKEFGLAEEVTKALKSSVEVCVMDWKLRHKCDESESVFIEERFLEHFIKKPQSPEIMVKWNKIVHEDKKLRQRQESYHMRQLAISQSFIEQQDKKLQIIKMLQKPNPDWNEIAKLEKASQRPTITMEIRTKEPPGGNDSP